MVPIPATPALISTASESAHTSTTGPTWWRASPQRRTNAFWLPMATMSVRPAAKPVRAVVSTRRR